MSFPIGAILPHLQRYGGVRRFIELGNEFIKKGYSFTLFLPKKEKKRARKYSWDFKGEMASFKEIGSHIHLFLLGHPRSPCTDVLPLLDKTIPIYIYVIAGGEYIRDYRKLEKRYPLVVNNRSFLEYFPKARVIEGGVNTSYFRPEKLRVAYHGAKGGTVEKELSLIPFIELIPLKNLDDESLLKAYQRADWFVSWEERPGWANMAAEALSCGCGVVSNGVNTQPFQDKIVVVDDLQEFFLDPLSNLNWKYVARKWEDIFKEDGLEIGEV